MHTEDRLVRPWKLISNSDYTKVSPNGTSMDDVMAYQGLMTITLKIDDNGKYHDFQKRLVKFNSIFVNESEVIQLIKYPIIKI